MNLADACRTFKWTAGYNGHIKNPGRGEVRFCEWEKKRGFTKKGQVRGQGKQVLGAQVPMPVVSGEQDHDDNGEDKLDSCGCQKEVWPKIGVKLDINPV